MVVSMMDIENGAVESMTHRGIGDTVCERLRMMILAGDLPAGTRLVEAKVAKDFNVSITPIRQAFATLAGQGLLTVIPYKGTHVSTITHEYVRDVVTMRETLEIAAFRLCAEKITKDDIEELEKTCHLSDEFFAKGDLFHAIRYDVMFHEYFFIKANSQLFMEIWSLLRSRIEYIQSITKRDIEYHHRLQSASYFVKRHSGMLDALKAGNAEAYESALLQHLKTSYAYSKFD